MSGQMVEISNLGLSRYEEVFAAMQAYTETRDAQTPDAIWFTEHEPVFTQGQAGKAEHVLAPGDIPVVQTDRGGQVTYHGPGQLVGYLLFDLKRRSLGVRGLVSGIENSIVALLEEYGVSASPRTDAPGVYVDGNKIASLGLRVRRGCSYHGLSLNVKMDLEPFARINPCGLLGMQVIDLHQLGVHPTFDNVRSKLTNELMSTFEFSERRLGTTDLLAI